MYAAIETSELNDVHRTNDPRAPPMYRDEYGLWWGETKRQAGLAREYTRTCLRSVGISVGYCTPSDVYIASRGRTV